MNPKDKRPDCCAEAGNAYDENAIEWRDADPGGDPLAFDDLPWNRPPHSDPKTPAEVNANRFWHTARLNQGVGLQHPAKPARYQVVVDWCPETEGNAYPLWGDATFCPFCGERFLPAEVPATSVAGETETQTAARVAVDAADAWRGQLGALARRLRDEKGKDANNWPLRKHGHCQCGSSSFRGPPTDTCPGCRVRDAVLEACAAEIDKVLA